MLLMEVRTRFERVVPVPRCQAHLMGFFQSILVLTQDEHLVCLCCTHLCVKDRSPGSPSKMMLGFTLREVYVYPGWGRAGGDV